MGFIEHWGDAALTSLGFFWKALWAFVLGYLVSSMIQVFVTRERMQRSMGGGEARGVGLGTFFGFVSSSCSFAALATTRAFLKKGAGLIPALAFLLASTNLVIELGIVIGVFLGWQFVVGEYVGGLILIGLVWLIVRVAYPERLMASVRDRLDDDGDDETFEVEDWREVIRTRRGWERVATTYWGEWRMVWKDVTVGFTVAGVIAVFVPASFFQALFLGSGGDGSIGPLAIVQQAVVGPIAAFFTFIGSMGNIPLAAVLVGSGVSFAGAMAFIFSDLIVFPVVRVNAQYYGWKMAGYITAVFLVALVVTAVILHGAFALLGVLPDGTTSTERITSDRFALDYTTVLNLAFLAISSVLAWLALSARRDESTTEDHAPEHQAVSA